MTEAPSPFIPGTALQYAWDSTSLSYLKECARKYYYAMVEGWRSHGENVHLEFGGHYHKALETFDRLRANGIEYLDALREVVHDALIATWDKEASKPKDWGHNLKTRNTLIRSIIWYLDLFQDDPAETIILKNGQPAVELSFRMNSDIEIEGFRWKGCLDPYVLCGHLDRVVEFGGNIYVMDRKTTGTTIGSYFFDQFHPDNQMSLYTFAAQVVYNEPVKGVIIDGAQIAVGFTRFERGFTYRTQAQLDEWFQDLSIHLRAAERYAEAKYWPMNDKACNNYGGCAFRGICSKDPGVRERFLESQFVRRPWNPLEVR